MQGGDIALQRTVPLYIKPALNKKSLLIRIICTVVASLAFLFWAVTLKTINVEQINDLGLVSALPPSFYIAVGVLCISFCILLEKEKAPALLLGLHLVMLILILYGVQTFAEEAPRFSVVYRHAGYMEYIMRTGGVDPTLDGYFTWPGFFILASALVQAMGLHDGLSIAGWAPIFYNLIYFGPLYMIFRAGTKNQRLIWLSLLIFYLTNWIAQDYFSPQGFNFFLYLTITAILLTWFQVPRVFLPRFLLKRVTSLRNRSVWFTRGSDWFFGRDPQNIDLGEQPRGYLIGIVLVIFAFIIFSHPLTPYFIIVAVVALVLVQRLKPAWLPLVMGGMTVTWLVTMGQTFLSGHASMVVGGFGHLQSTLSTNVTQRVGQGDEQHLLVANIRLLMSGLLWLLALGGGVKRLRQGYHDLSLIVLAIAPFVMVVTQDYGGELFLRVYLFSSPIMAFFAASLFYSAHQTVKKQVIWWRLGLVICCVLVLMGGFCFTRYGKERVDYKTYQELDGIKYLYSIAPTNSLFFGSWFDAPLQYEAYEKYSYYTMNDVIPEIFFRQNAGQVEQFIKQHPHANAYILFSRSETATASAFSGVSEQSMKQLKLTLVESGKFRLVYDKPDISILQYVGDSGKKSTS